jgi:hypothetical protein
LVLVWGSTRWVCICVRTAPDSTPCNSSTPAGAFVVDLHRPAALIARRTSTRADSPNPGPIGSAGRLQIVAGEGRVVSSHHRNRAASRSRGSRLVGPAVEGRSALRAPLEALDNEVLMVLLTFRTAHVGVSDHSNLSIGIQTSRTERRVPGGLRNRGNRPSRRAMPATEEGPVTLVPRGEIRRW